MNYVVTRETKNGKYVLPVTLLLNFTKRGATQLKNSLAKADPRFNGRAIMAKTARKEDLL
jgi:hypothetical protein